MQLIFGKIIIIIIIILLLLLLLLLQIKGGERDRKGPF